MSALDTLKSILLKGPDNYLERLAPNIKFVSPSGNEFKALWVEDDRKVDKKLAIHAFPKVKGNIVKDLEINSWQYSITFFFTGKDNDLESRRFLKVIEEAGPWEINHPVHGFLGLQPVSFTHNVRPLSDGTFTEINSEWIEPIDETTLLTAREAAGIIDDKKNELNISAAQQLANNLKQGTEVLKKSIETGTRGINNLTDFFLEPLFTTVDSLNVAVNAAQNGAIQTTQATVVKTDSLAGQLQSTIQLPLFASDDTDGRLSTYGDLAVAQFALISDGTQDEDLNNVVMAELALSATIGALGQIITTGTLDTRAQALDAANALAEIFNAITDRLDEVQSAFGSKDIDEQYFSQSQSFSDAVSLISLSVRYLLTAAFELKVERRFVLETAKPPWTVCAEEYGTVGENEEVYDLFLESNNLKADERIILPAGKEILVYV